MSSDLVKRLMTYGDGSPGGILLMREAAARIEALEGEVARWRSSAANASANEAAAEARAKWLQAVLARIANLDPSQEPWACAIARKALSEDDKQ